MFEHFLQRGLCPLPPRYRHPLPQRDLCPLPQPLSRGRERGAFFIFHWIFEPNFPPIISAPLSLIARGFLLLQKEKR